MMAGRGKRKLAGRRPFVSGMASRPRCALVALAIALWPHATSHATPAVAAAAAAPAAAPAAPSAATSAQPTPTPPVPERAAVLDKARTDAAAGDYEMARAALYQLLMRDRRDDEARAMLGRVNAWSGRRQEAMSQYRQVLSRYPDDVEVLSGLVDVLLWEDRWVEARFELDEGLKRHPDAVGLLERQARLAFYSHDLDRARAVADRAASLAPPSEPLQRLRERLWRGELRFSLRWAFYPQDFPDLPEGELLIQQRWNALTVYARTLQARRFSTVEGLAEHNASYTIGANYHLSKTVQIFGELGLGAPALAIARYAGALGATLSIGERWTPSMGYAFRYYDGDRQLHILHPSITFGVTDNFHLSLNYWIGLVVISPGALADGDALAADVHTIGPGVVWRPVHDLSLHGLYTYGTQTELVPALFKLANIRSHTVAVWLDHLISRHGGISPSYQLEVRENQGNRTMLIHTLGTSSYLRW